jgi:hypothetical protein
MYSHNADSSRGMVGDIHHVTRSLLHYIFCYSKIEIVLLFSKGRGYLIQIISVVIIGFDKSVLIINRIFRFFACESVLGLVEKFSCKSLIS